MGHVDRQVSWVYTVLLEVPPLGDERGVPVVRLPKADEETLETARLRWKQLRLWMQAACGLL